MFDNIGYQIKKSNKKATNFLKKEKLKI